jgi:hypothetical protein
MSAIPRPSTSFAVPDKLLWPLRKVARRQWSLAVAVGGLQTLTLGLAAVLAGAMLLGQFGNLPAILRVPIAAITWAMVLWAAVRFLRPATRRWSPSESAQLVERRLPNMHERLSSAVELAAESDGRFTGSASLIAVLLRQAENDAAAIRPELIVRSDRVKRWAFCLTPVVAAWLVLAILMPRPLGAGIYRLFRPMENQLPTMLSQVTVSPGNVTLCQGDSLDIAARFSTDAAAKDKWLDGVTLVTKFPDGSTQSTPMSVLTARQFKITLAGVQRTFQYQVTGGSVASAWFTATVNPRPAVTSLDVRYDFPPYTGLETKFVKAGDGTIEGLVGAKVTLTIHATGPLSDKADAKNQLLLDESRQTRTAVALSAVSDNDYQASFIINHSGQYRIQLCNEFGLTNRDDQLRNIIAHFDQPPTIQIESPAASETARPDDDVPVHYVATDDFAVASISAIVQADDNPPREVAISLGAGDRKLIRGVYTISVADIAAQSNPSDISRITYQLKATDNRDPDPQSTFTPKQILTIDRNSRSYAEKADEQRDRELNRAIQQAAQHLNEAEGKSSPLRNGDPNHSPSDQEKQSVQEAQRELSDAAQELHDAADAAQDTPFAAVGQKAQQIADQPVAQAAEHTAKAQLADDQPQKRVEEANQAQQQIAAARDQLGQLRNQIEQARQQADAARDLQQAAKLQAQAARDLAENPQKTSQNQDTQRQATQKLAEAMQKDSGLRDTAAQQVAQHLADLANHVQDVQNQQSRQQAQTAKQQQLAQVQNQSNKLAQQQKKLNGDIQHFAQQDQKPIERSYSQLPSADAQNGIVAALDRNDVDSATQQMRQQARQLNDAAHQLQQQADQAQNSAQDRQTDRDAAGEAQQLAQAQRQLAQAADPLRAPAARARDGAEPADQTAQEQQQLADQTRQAEQQAQALSQEARQSQDSDIVRRADAAGKELERASGDQRQSAQDEQQGDPDHAAEHQQASGQELAQAQSALRGLGEPDNPDGQADAGQPESAAQRAEEAAAVQPQAMQSNPQAAQEAANALQRAAAANAQRQPGKPDDDQTTGQEPGHATDLPMPALVSSQGISPQQGDGAARPEAVRALGISAADWARLPTLLRGELMNAAQQTGPPEYREMIKNYYVRIAREQAEAGAVQP